MCSLSVWHRLGSVGALSWGQFFAPTMGLHPRLIHVELCLPSVPAGSPALGNWQLQSELSVSLACTEKTRKALAEGWLEELVKQMQPLKIRAVITAFEGQGHVSNVGQVGIFFLLLLCSVTEPVLG